VIFFEFFAFFCGQPVQLPFTGIENSISGQEKQEFIAVGF
jgi:hypothetical protein